MRSAKPTVPFGALVQVNGGLTPVTSELQLYASSKCDVIVGLEIVNFPTLLPEGTKGKPEEVEVGLQVGKLEGELGDVENPEVDGIFEGIIVELATTGFAIGVTVGIAVGYTMPVEQLPEVFADEEPQVDFWHPAAPQP